eukprot:TRINITY_DN1673_c0_g1_i1.p2 TRINITY_DN1673_c0_g1~~TRINITY_DN1673_c0_g1_i1.p2  ORF type:complete len:108 (+),score=20.17 TRINITY_DN1673_c0_g1_i1:461-784(+)
MVGLIPGYMRGDRDLTQIVGITYEHLDEIYDFISTWRLGNPGHTGEKQNLLLQDFGEQFLESQKALRVVGSKDNTDESERRVDTTTLSEEATRRGFWMPFSEIFVFC